MKHKPMNADDLRNDDVVMHAIYGLISITNVEYENGMKVLFVC